MLRRFLAGVVGACAWGAESVHVVPYVPSASSATHAGAVRLGNRSARSGEVRVVAVDDAGQRMEAGRLTLGAGAAVEFEPDPRRRAGFRSRNLRLSQPERAGRQVGCV